MHTQNSPSLVRALLSLPSIGADGVERSILFGHLPLQAQNAIRAASSESAKQDIAAAAGDALPIIGQMHAHYVTQPQERRAQGIAFADYPLPGVVEPEDHAWLRQNQRIEAIKVIQTGDGWAVSVGYEDGETRAVPTKDGQPYPTPDAADQRRQQAQATAYILGLLD